MKFNKFLSVLRHIQMKRIIFLFITIFIRTLILAQNAPYVYNVRLSQRTDGSKIVDISYDVNDADGDSLEISLKLSNDGGVTFTIAPDNANLSGDVGSGIMPGTDKSITWYAGNETTDSEGDNFQLKIIADDSPAPAIPAGFVFVQGGTFQMGDRNSEGNNNELPLHDVTLSSFYMAITVVIQSEYSAIMGANPAHNYGVGNNYPVYFVSWYDAIKYCNKKSINDGLTPCYRVNGDTNPDNWGNSFTPMVNWRGNGYRLPTEAEWEYAARGGIHESDNYRYSGCNTNSHLANYAWYNENNTPNGSKEVATKLPNQLGLYDMSGNEWEWCWDCYNNYTNDSQINPHGLANGDYRILRGGAWDCASYHCRVARREHNNPNSIYSFYGFRILRIAE